MQPNDKLTGALSRAIERFLDILMKMHKEKSILIIALAMTLVACGGSESPGTPKTAESQESAVIDDIAPSPMTIFHNANIHTVHADSPQVEAMAVSEAGMILATGEASALEEAYPNAQKVDLLGRTVIPGLIDAHAHLIGLALNLSRAQLAGTQDVDEILERLKAFEQELGEDDWLLGRGWDQNDWPSREFPSREDLDAHFPDRPVWLRRIDGHAGWANSAALAQVDRDLSGSWQEQGGFIHRDTNGQPTGILIDGAMGLVESQVPDTSIESINQGLDLAIDLMLSLGLTGMHDAGASQQAVALYQDRIERNEFDTRVYAMTDGAGATLDWLCDRGAIEDPSGRLVMRSTKLYSDGALGSRGAAMLEDYSDDPGNRGLLFMSEEEIQAQVDKVMACGFQVAVHAIGDAGNRQVLDALETGMSRHPENPGRHRVEHAQILTADDLGRFANLGVVASMQPTHATSDMYWAEERVGPDRIQYGYAWKDLKESGAHLAWGSDFPVEEVSPMLGLYAAVTRQDREGTPDGGWYPEQRVTREAALRGFTLDAAWAGFMESEVGSLQAGKRADFVVLDRDPMSVPEDQLDDIQVLETWMDGDRVWPR